MIESEPGMPSGSRPDAVRIVPLRPSDDTSLVGALALAGPAELTFHGGHVLSTVEVVAIYWGAEWASGSGKAVADQVDAFFDAILVSPLIDQLAEYGRPGAPIGHGRRARSTTIPTPAPPSPAVTDAEIRTFLHERIAAGVLPQPTPDTLYFVYLPSGVGVVQGGSRSCQSFCGYHDDVGGGLFYAVMPFPGCDGCIGGLAVVDALTSTSSHELCEAITDPVPGQGWYDDVNGAEIGDLCAWRTKQVAGFTVQQEWSDRANGCV